MLFKNYLIKELAVASNSGAMEEDTILKTGGVRKAKRVELTIINKWQHGSRKINWKNKTKETRKYQ